MPLRSAVSSPADAMSVWTVGALHDASSPQVNIVTLKLKMESGDNITAAQDAREWSRHDSSTRQRKNRKERSRGSGECLMQMITCRFGDAIRTHRKKSEVLAKLSIDNQHIRKCNVPTCKHGKVISSASSHTSP